MTTLEAYYDLSPVGVLDQNQWDERRAEVQLNFRRNAIYTPLITWQASGPAQNQWEYDLIPGDVDSDEISMTANYIDTPQSFDTRMRKYVVKRWGDKVQMHKSDARFNQFIANGSRDWRPLLRGALGDNILRKHEILSRNVFMNGPKTYWTFADAAGAGHDAIGDLTSSDVFSPSIVNAWNLRLGNTGNTFIPGAVANAKLAIIPPGVKFDLFEALPAASANEAALWRDVMIYGSQTPILNYEIGTFKNVRFVEAPNDDYGINPNVLYNTGVISFQHAVTAPIKMGDGAPDPETTAVDGIFYVGQKGVTHYIQLEAFGASDYAVGDIVTIHVKRSSAYGVTNGVDPLDGKLIHRRIVAIDAGNDRLSFDRPIMRNLTAAFYDAAGSVTTAAAGTFYGFVTKARHIGFVLVLGSNAGVVGKVVEPIQFHNPAPVDDFESVWRLTWDAVMGWNVKDPHYFECHFCAVSLPKPGGIIAP